MGSAVAGTVGPAAQARALNRALAKSSLWFAAFAGGFVLFEPAPYDLWVAALIGVWAITVMRLSKTVMPLLVMLMIFNAGGMISMTQMQDWTGAPLYVAISFFLAFSSVFFAAVIESDETLLGPIINGYIGAAVITGFLGIIGYFGVGAELFTKFDRAKGAFEDPNVFGPFLCLPLLICLWRIMTRPLAGIVVPLAAMVVLLLAVLLSFSRAAWGLSLFSMSALIGYMLIAFPSGRFRLRVVALGIVALVVGILALGVALQFDTVSDMLTQRAKLVQDYDGARVGRFARHIIGFQLMTEHPLGIGIMQFSDLYGEDPHNVYLKSLTDYSWVGFLAYVTLVFTTLGVGVKIMFRARPWTPIVTCTVIALFGHILIGMVIDTDHWRHFFLLVGIIWGCAGLERRWQMRHAMTATAHRYAPRLAAARS